MVKQAGVLKGKILIHGGRIAEADSCAKKRGGRI
jgi:hypothetical protein